MAMASMSSSTIRKSGVINGGDPWLPSGSDMEGNLSSSPPSTSRTTTKPQQNVIKINGSTGMDCQMDWIGDFMPMYLTSSEKDDYIKGVIKNLKEWLEDIKGTIVSPGTDLNVKLMLASYYACLDNFHEALDWVNEAVDSLKSLTNECAEHLRAYSYLIQLNFHKINRRRMKLVEGMSLKLVEEATSKDLMEIMRIYSEDGRSFQAIICFAKALLAKSLKHQEHQIKLCKKAIELEPECAQWYRGLYVVLRKRRRDDRERRFYSPSFEERQAITKAYELNPSCCLNQSCYASMLEEKIKGNEELVLPNTKEESGNLIISLMTSALEKNPAHKWTHVRLAEVYAYGNFPHLDSKDGEHMFEELEERWPESSMVLHKFGKYFTVALKNHKKALEYYSRALECDSSNFPCLMDYLKTLRFGKDYREMLAMVNKCLGCLHYSAPMAKMLLAKGILLWLMEEQGDTNDADFGTRKLKACQAWVEAVEGDPARSSKHIAKMISSRYWNIIGDYFIDVNEVINNLSVLLNASNAHKKNQINSINRLISELQAQSHSNRPPAQGGRLGPRQRTMSASSSRSTLSDCSYVTARSSWSQADVVDNWRDSLRGVPTSVGGTGIFAKYEDHADIQFRGGFKSGLHPSGGGPVKQKGSGGDPSLADLDNDWRR